MATATDKVEHKFNAATYKTQQKHTTEPAGHPAETYDRTSGPWDLSVAKEKNPTKQAKLTANTVDHTSANLTVTGGL